MGPKTIIFLKHFASLEEFPPSIASITNVVDGTIVYQKQTIAPAASCAKLFAIQDVPGYLNMKMDPNVDFLQHRTITTQQTYVIDLDGYSDIGEYLEKHLGAKSRSSLRRYKKKLESCFSIHCHTYYGNIDRTQYDTLFENLRDLMTRRFEQKKEQNYELQHLEEIKKDIYPKICQKQASIFVIHADGSPISIRINLMKGKLAYYLLSAFDPDFEIFRIGKLDMWYNINWMMDHGYEKYDLLKGYGYIKKRWSDSVYPNNLVFVNHDGSLLGQIKFFLMFYRTKVWLDMVRVLKQLRLHQIVKSWKKNGLGIKKKETTPLLPISCETDLEIDAYPLGKFPNNKELRNSIFTLAYKHSFPVNSIKVSQKKDDPRQFLITIGDNCYLFNFDKNNSIG